MCTQWGVSAKAPGVKTRNSECMHDTGKGSELADMMQRRMQRNIFCVCKRTGEEQQG